MRFEKFVQYFRSSHIGMTPALSINELMPSSSRSTVYPLQLSERNRQFTFNGSAAIYQAIVDMQLQRSDVVLLPAYCCGAELSPFEQLGCKILFYDVNADLSVNRQQIQDYLIQRSDLKLLLITHYLGLAQPDIAELSQACRERDVLLLEDCAHALYCQSGGVPLGSYGDYAIFSPRKSLPLTEGGILVSSNGFDDDHGMQFTAPPLLARLDRLFYSLLQGMRSQPATGVNWILNKLAIVLGIVPSLVLKLVKASRLIPADAWLTPDVEGREARPVYYSTCSTFSQRILYSTDADGVVASRRKNHAHWVGCLTGNTNARIVHPVLPDGCCPLYFVIQVSDPAHCVAALQENDIESFNWWQHMPEIVNWQAYPQARQLKQSLLALPVHQRLTLAQIETMATRLTQILAS